MVILPNPNPKPCSIILQPRKNPFSLPTSMSIATATQKQASRFTIISTSNTSSYQTKNQEHFVNSYAAAAAASVLQEHQPLTTRDDGDKEDKSGISSKLKPNPTDHEALEIEVESIIGRLMTVAERIRELEIEKLVKRFTGPLSNEDRLYVENSSREIIYKFMDRPICYLKSGCGDLKQKSKDLNLLIRMLEKSCIESQR